VANQVPAQKVRHRAAIIDSKLIAQLLEEVAIFAKACFGHPSPSKRQKLNATAKAFGYPDSSSVRHDAQRPSGTLSITAAQMT